MANSENRAGECGEVGVEDPLRPTRGHLPRGGGGLVTLVWQQRKANYLL